jgi:protein involved in temperature-dependent protein secretion
MQGGSYEALLLLASLFSLHGKSAKAAALLEGLHELRPEDTRATRLLCHSLLEGENCERVLALIHELLDSSEEPLSGSDRACVLRMRAAALLRLGRPEEARAALEETPADLASSQQERSGHAGNY